MVLLPHYQQGAASAVEGCFSYLGATPIAMLKTMILHPQLVLTHKVMVYLKQILTPFGILLPSFSPITIVALPFLLINVAGDPGCNAAIVFRHYSLIPSILLLPGVISAVRWIGTRPKMSPSTPSILAFALFLASAGATLLSIGDSELSWWQYSRWQAEANRVAAFLPPAAAVAVPRYMLPLTANREYVYQTLRLLDYHHPSAEFIVVDRDHTRMGVTSEWQDHYDRLLAQLRDPARFTTVYSSDNFMVYQLVGTPLVSLRPEGVAK
jgi:Predicted membrane protein (DUF2079)